VAVVTDSEGSPTTTLTALDGMPLAVAGGFGLTSTPVTVAGVTGFFGNVPLFSNQILALSAAVDRTLASAGDRLGYTINFGPGNRTPPAPLSSRSCSRPVLRTHAGVRGSALYRLSRRS